MTKYMLLVFILGGFMCEPVLGEQIPPEELNKMRAEEINHFRNLIKNLQSNRLEDRINAASNLSQSTADHTGINYYFNSDEFSIISNLAEKDENPSVRVMILSQLSNIKRFSDEGRVIELLKKLSQIESVEIRSEARYQLFFCQNNYDESEMLEYIIFDQIGYSNPDVIYKSELMGHEVVTYYYLNEKVLAKDSNILVPKIVEVLRKNTSERLLYEALEVLSLIGSAGEVASKNILNLLSNKSPVVRYHAYVSLMRPQGELTPDKKKYLFNIYLSALDDEYWRIRKLSIEAFQALGMFKEIPDDILKKISNDEIIMVKEAVLRASL